MKKVLRKIFMSDLPIQIAYLARMGLFYYLVAFIFLIIAYLIVDDTVKNPGVAKLVFVKLLFSIIALGILFFMVTYLYARIVSRDYEEVSNFADTLSKGNFEKKKVELSFLADYDLIRIEEALERLRKSLIISRKILDKRNSSR